MVAVDAIDSEGNIDPEEPDCKPKPEKLMQQPIRLKFFQLDQDTHLYQTRKLLGFFPEEENLQVSINNLPPKLLTCKVELINNYPPI